MKRVTVLGLLVVLTGPAVALAAEATPVTTRHVVTEKMDLNSKSYLLARAAHYDQLAKEEGANIEEHQKLKADAQKLRPQVTRTPVPNYGPRDTGRILKHLTGSALAEAISGMEKHCDIILQDSGALKEEYENSAKLYRERAAKLGK